MKLQSCIFLIALLFDGAEAIARANLFLLDVRCSTGVNDKCRTQCTANGCYGATDVTELNACLEKLDPDCTVDIQGDLHLALQRDVDFCNIEARGEIPASWLVNIPFIDRFQRIYDPFLVLPQSTSRVDPSYGCEFNADQIYLQEGQNAAAIAADLCHDTVLPVAGAYPVHRDFAHNANYWYPISVFADVNVLKVRPARPECFNGLGLLGFVVSVQDRIAGGMGINLKDYVTTGTPPIESIAPPVPVIPWK